MTVLIEAISVVIRADRLLDVYPGGWDAFRNDVPNATMCADNELVRVGFMTPQDVEDYVGKLSDIGLTDMIRRRHNHRHELRSRSGYKTFT